MINLHLQMTQDNPDQSAYRFPSIGELWHYLFFTSGLINLNQAVVAAPDAISAKRAKVISDELNDCGREEKLPAPSRINELLEEVTSKLPHGKRLNSLLQEVCEMLMQHHQGLCVSQFVQASELEMRRRYAFTSAPIIYSVLVFLHLGLRRIYGADQSWLNQTPLGVLSAYLEGLQAGRKTPLNQQCFRHEASGILGENPNFEELGARWVDPRALKRWYDGEVAASLPKLMCFYSKAKNPQDLTQADRDQCASKLIAQCFSSLLEGVFSQLHGAISKEQRAPFWNTIVPMLIPYEGIDRPDSSNRGKLAEFSDEDYFRHLRVIAGQEMKRISDFNYIGEKDERPEEADETGWAAVSYGKYFRPNSVSGIIVGRLGALIEATKLSKTLTLGQISQLREAVNQFRERYPVEAVAMRCVLTWIEARLTIADFREPASARLERAVELYLQAFDDARYRAGGFTKGLVLEVLGFLSWLWRENQASTLSSVKRIFKWWDLMELGGEFDHAELERRIELAASSFESSLDSKLFDLLTIEIPELKCANLRVGGLSISTMSGIEERLNKSIRPNRKELFKSEETVFGLDSSPLMEAINKISFNEDAKKIEAAQRLVNQLINRGADLNFISASGNSAFTYAMTDNHYDIVLKMLQRAKAPVSHQTLLQPTKALRLNLLVLTLLRCRLEILQELVKAGPDGVRDRISMDDPLPNGKTSLVFMVQVIAWTLMEPDAAKPRIVEDLTLDRAEPVNRFEFLRFTQLKAMNLGSTAEAMSCFEFLLGEVSDVDTPNHNQTTALLLAAHYGLHDVVFALLQAGANVNHCNEQGVVPIYYAIRDDNVQLARLLVDGWGADTTRRVADPERHTDEGVVPIHGLPMSAAMRAVIPYRG